MTPQREVEIWNEGFNAGVESLVPVFEKVLDMDCCWPGMSPPTPGEHRKDCPIQIMRETLDSLKRRPDVEGKT